MDETGVLLSVLNSLKVLVGSNDLRKHRGAGVQRTLITAIECISADGKCLDPLIIWPAVAHRSTWTVHPTPGWHFACSKTGYTNSEISLYWIKNVFDPQTRECANGSPRVLISDGFGTHESLEILTYCFEHNIILGRLPSHTSHKLQPCDIGVFGPLKTAYREQVELLYRQGSNAISKQHFTLLYSRARQVAVTLRNVRSGWAKAGLFPFNPDRVLGDMPRPVLEPPSSHSVVQSESRVDDLSLPLETPTTATFLSKLRCRVEGSISPLDEDSKLCIQKLANAAEGAFAERALLLDENRVLFEQNNEKTIRQTTKTTVVGKAKIMRYEDIVEAQSKRNERELNKARKKSGESTKKPGRSRGSEAEEAEAQIAAMGLSDYCLVLQL
ncbi:related to transposase [Ramularia collo-cygni]|uniref:Related to transposase n=1 Tax=Ramularia collo-cygni TaxID=112498 RepID=A0A2D3VEA0_9PEZI|nr:related to transposase [Ramularia collo-cygni]CZT24135.1 related to transposase [Ramularia collo-cygni]